MGSAGEHTFIRKQAAPALVRAMDALSEKTGKPIDHYDGMALSQIYQLVEDVHGDDIPDFWRNWKAWDDFPDDPSPSGDPGDEI
ncbi:MAG: hypothetical protein O2955_09455 [Planctomycetota bacterium]|nr:hypothetical protein [Planctomycetota bacterium]MDA1212735.1 hypothetical protein [Planctomycetota bacterium]